MVALGQWQSREVALITSAKPLDLTSREPLLPGGFSRGRRGVGGRRYLLRRRNPRGEEAHTKGCIAGPSNIGPPEQLEVSWEHRVDGGTNNLGVIPDKT